MKYTVLAMNTVITKDADGNVTKLTENRGTPADYTTLGEARIKFHKTIGDLINSQNKDACVFILNNQGCLVESTFFSDIQKDLGHPLEYPSE